MRCPLLFAVLAGLVLAGPAAAVPVACSDPAAESCTLRVVADAAGVRIGAAVANAPFQNDARYREVLAREFNSVTAENVMKWPGIHPEADRYEFAAADQLLDFAEANGMRARGHTLLWANPLRIPDYVNQTVDPDLLRAHLTDHIGSVVGRYAGRIDAWDVVNEPLDNFDVTLYDNVFLDLLGPDYIADAFHLAHAADPDATLFLNEVLIHSTENNPRFDAFYQLVVDLLAEGVPIHGIGLQSHYLANVIQPSAEDIRDVVQAFADLGLVVELTELDVAMPGMSADRLERQAAIVENAMRACLSVSACEGVTFWGFSDAHTWIDGTFGPGFAPLPFDEEFSPKPAYFGARRALFGRLPEPGTGLLLGAAWVFSAVGTRRRPAGSGSCPGPA